MTSDKGGVKWTRPVLLIFGKTRVGKGELIETIVAASTGEELNITSAGMTSHTRVAKGYEAAIRGEDVLLYDTVGFGDTDVKSNVAEDALLKLLANTKKAKLYPPLYILSDMDSVNRVFVEKILEIFPEVNIAVRGEEEKFNGAEDELKELGIKPTKIFHLPDFYKEYPESRQEYENAVSDIMDEYATLQPTRKNLNFSSTMFKGTIVKEFVKTETREEVQNDVEEKDVEETVIITKERIEKTETGYHYVTREEVVEHGNIGLQIFSLGFAGNEKRVKHHEKVPEYDVRTVRDQVPTPTTKQQIRKTATRVCYARQLFDVYKVTSGNIRIYMTEEVSDWKETGREVVDIAIE